MIRLWHPFTYLAEVGEWVPELQGNERRVECKYCDSKCLPLRFNSFQALALSHNSVSSEQRKLASAIDPIAKVGYDPVYGARPLKRAIQKELKNPIATKILEEAFPEGSTIQVALQSGKLAFTCKQDKAAIAPAPDRRTPARGSLSQLMPGFGTGLTLCKAKDEPFHWVSKLVG